MSETTGQELSAVASEVPPPEVAQVPATAPEADTQAADDGQDTAAPKTFTQAELDDILQKRLAKAEAKAERRVLRILESQQTQKQPQYQQPQTEARPQRQSGEGDDAYLDRLTDWKLDQRDRAKDALQAAHEPDSRRQDRAHVRGSGQATRL